MIRLEYPKFNIEGLRDSEKLSTIKRQLDTLTNNIQLVLESISGDVETLSEFVGNNNEAENSENISTITEAITSITETIGELEGRDYIVEQGTSGIWTYRKWNSGIAECWGMASGTTTCNTVWGSSLQITPTLSAAFPSDFFVSTPCVNITSKSVGNSSLIVFNTGVTTKDEAVFQLGRPTAIASIPYAVDIQAKGRWK